LVLRLLLQPVQPIYMMRNIGLGTSPTACTWHVQPIHIYI
jgi:hypothetical protein